MAVFRISCLTMSCWFFFFTFKSYCFYIYSLFLVYWLLVIYYNLQFCIFLGFLCEFKGVAASILCVVPFHGLFSFGLFVVFQYVSFCFYLIIF